MVFKLNFYYYIINFFFFLFSFLFSSTTNVHNLFIYLFFLSFFPPPPIYTTFSPPFLFTSHPPDIHPPWIYYTFLFEQVLGFLFLLNGKMQCLWRLKKWKSFFGSFFSSREFWFTVIKLRFVIPKPGQIFLIWFLWGWVCIFRVWFYLKFRSLWRRSLFFSV